MNNAEKKIDLPLIIPTKTLINGDIATQGSVAIDRALLPEQFSSNNLMLVVTDSSQYIVDCSHSDIIKGRYIIQMEGKYSINQLSRAAGNKIIINIVDVPLVFDRSKINIIGKVITSINQEY